MKRLKIDDIININNLKNILQLYYYIYIKHNPIAFFIEYTKIYKNKYFYKLLSYVI